MTLKRWFAWACLILTLVAEVLLFKAIRDKDAMQMTLHDNQAHMRQMARDLQTLRHSDAGRQATEILGLRKQNQILTNRLAAFQGALDQLEADYLQATQQLATARTALALQQDHLKKLKQENQLVTDASIRIIQRNICINNLREIDGAKQQWALENNMPMDAVPTVKDLLPYLKEGVFPSCPAGGTYSINSVEDVPTCSIPGHALPK